MKKVISALLCFGVLICCETRVAEKEKLNQTAQSYLYDFNQLVDTLITYHPAIYEFTPQKEFNTKITQLRSEIDNNTSKRDLFWKLEEIIAMAGDGHTGFGFFGSYSDLIDFEDYFPLQARLIKNQFVVIDPMLNADKISKGDIITSVNGKPIEEVLNIIYKHIPSQAHMRSGKKGMFNAFQDLYIPFALNFPESFKIEIKGKRNAIQLVPINQQPKYPPMISPKSPCQMDFCLTEIDEQTVLLTLRTFAYYGERTSNFISFLDKSFKTIQKERYSNLIIDVRGNLGGTSRIPRHLLRYTLDKPFVFFSKSDFDNLEELVPFENSFKGKIIVLISGDGFSSVGQLASIYKDKERAIFVGEALGSNHFNTANQKQFQLTNTKFNYTVARNIFVTNVKERNPKSKIEPDYYVEQSIKDYFTDKDVVLEKAIELYKNK